MSKVTEALKDEIHQQLEALKKDNFSNAEKILEYARLLRGLSFNDVLSLQLSDSLPNATYADKKRKGGVGNLLEKHYFGYTPNSDSQPDFINAGLELKASPVERYIQKRGENKGKETIKAGERLVLSMIPNNKEIASTYAESDLRKKASHILLINYLRNRDITNLEQEIILTNLFSPNPEDLKIIEDDYRIIAEYVREGRAHELSEGLTKYLGACTKGATAEKSLRKQFYPFTHEDGTEEYIPAKSRAFSFKQSYMTSIVQKFKNQQDRADKLLSRTQGKGLEDIANSRIKQYVGRTSEDIKNKIAPDLELITPKNGINKASYRKLVMNMLQAPSGRIEEFEKAGIKVRVIRLNKAGRPEEHIKLGLVRFSELTNTEWEDSSWYEMLTVPRYMFVVFQENHEGAFELRGSLFWAVPMQDVGVENSQTPTKESALGYWLDTKEKISQGLTFTQQGKRWLNNLLNASEHPVCHLRPSAPKAAYRFANGTEIGNVSRHGDELPDGQVITRQALWLSKDYIKEVVEEFAR